MEREHFDNLFPGQDWLKDGPKITPVHVRTAFRERSLRTHPDKGGNCEAFNKVYEAFKFFEGKPPAAFFTPRDPVSLASFRASLAAYFTSSPAASPRTSTPRTSTPRTSTPRTSTPRTSTPRRRTSRPSSSSPASPPTTPSRADDNKTQASKAKLARVLRSIDSLNFKMSLICGENGKRSKRRRKYLRDMLIDKRRMLIEIRAELKAKAKITKEKKKEKAKAEAKKTAEKKRAKAKRMAERKKEKAKAKAAKKAERKKEEATIRNANRKAKRSRRPQRET